MIANRLILCCVLWFIALFGPGCALTPQPSLPMTASVGASPSSPLTEINSVLASASVQSTSASVRGYRLGPEDLIRVTIFNIPEGEGAKVVTPRVMEARINHQGTITLPLLSEVPVQGLIVSEAEQKLRELYDKYIQSPQIGINVIEYRSQRVAVVGAVKSPGVFDLSGPKTVIDLLATSGGLSATASNQVHLYRESPEGRQSYMIDLLTVARGVGSDVSVLSLLVQGGDVITVPEAGSFFVDGAVRRPGSFALNRPYTVTQALVTAGGVDRELAKTSSITLFRHRNGSEVKSVTLDLEEIISGKQPDPEVGAEDVIVVPISAPKYVVRRFLGVLVSGFSMERLVIN